ncbi:hypothetical protein EV356DRAFT_59055 [Viridothelium virens]|uniref:3-deoxy-D-arabino-heptulosonate 7-phosphate synthase n=1 Tax=Viridothelium virens TaxID=1048519 RepID=A0A6A6GSD3_VIRVR|nr:hypothetical protein EV356DRAFT_59055 [Viridothelium virens]
MLESNIHAGRQEVGIAGAIQLEKGISITDGCISFESTVQVIEELASAVRTRRELVSASSRSLLKVLRVRYRTDPRVVPIVLY